MEILRIGKYRIVSGYTNLTLLIVNDDGKTVEVKKDELEKILEKIIESSLGRICSMSNRKILFRIPFTIYWLCWG